MHQRSPIASTTDAAAVSAASEDDSEPPQSPDRNLQRDPLFQPGDEVATTRNEINCRAWMSSVAPIRCRLDKGAHATILSEPFRFGPYLWVKIRIAGSGIEGCLPTKYLELIEPASKQNDLHAHTSTTLSGPRSDHQSDDVITTVARLNLRASPGVNSIIVQVIDGNASGVVLGPPVMHDDMSWIPVRFSAATGWVAAKHTHVLNRNEKWIEVDLSRQRLQSHSMDGPSRSFVVSSGKATHATPTGTYAITKKLPVRLLSATVREESWRIPGVPWIMVFRRGGFYIHAAYWHTDFGNAVSHGCITLAPDDAEWLYEWTPLDTPIWIHDGTSVLNSES